MSKNKIPNQDDFKNSLEVFYDIQLDEYQKVYRDAIWSDEKKIIFCNAKAGTGKTTIAVGVANLLCQSGKYKGMYYIISPTQEMRQGFLPGDSESKSAPYMEPLYQALGTLGINPLTSVVSSDNVKAIKEGTAFIEAIPHTYLRGTNFENRVVILDEMANFYRSDVKKTLSRIHDNCKVVCIGHTEQCDLYKNPKNSGFKAAMDLYASKNDSRVAICELKINHRGWISTVADELDSEIVI